MIVGYCENSKAYRIYALGQRNIKFSKDITFDEDAALWKAIDTPRPANVDRQNDALDAQEDPKPEIDLVDEPMDPLDPSLCARKRWLWFRDTLQDADRHAAPKGTLRESMKPCRFQGYVVAMSNIIQVEPCTFQEAVKAQVWKDAMAEEYESIIHNDIWELVPKPQGKSVVSSKWLHKIKHVVNGSIEKFKARFVARGFSHKEGIDYDEICAPVFHYTILWSIVALVASRGWPLHQMNEKIAFLHDFIKEEVFVEQPQGFEVHGQKTHVFRLKKALYGLKQAPRDWYACIGSFLLKVVFTRSNVDPNLYFKTIQGMPFDFGIICLWFISDWWWTSYPPV